MHKRVSISVVCLLLFLTGTANLFIWKRNTAANPPVHLPAIPFAFNGWKGAPFAAPISKDDKGRFLLARTYRSKVPLPVHLLVIFSEHYTYGADSHMPSICYRGAGWLPTEPIRMTTPSGRITLTGFRGRNGEDEILVLYGFHVGDRIVPDGLSRKRYEVRHRLRYGGFRHLLVEITLTYTPRQRSLAAEQIRRFLEGLEPSLLGSKTTPDRI